MSHGLLSRGAVSLADYQTAPGVFDINAVIAAMEKSLGACIVPAGDWTPDHYNVALDGATVPNTGDLPARFTYEFKGAGKHSRILLPSGMGSGDNLFVANSANNLSSFTSHPRMVFQDLAFTGYFSPNAGVLLSHQRSFTMQRVYLTSLLNAVVHDGYSDLVRLEQVYATQMTAGGWVFTGNANGDGLVIDQLMAYATGGINLSNCLGATIRGCISGYHKFRNCDVVFDGMHVEGDGTTTTTPTILLKGCTAHVRSGYYEARKYRPTFQIDDETDTLISRVTFDRNVHFAQRFDDPASTYGALRAVDIDIQSMSKQSELVLNSPRAYCFGASTAKPGYVAGAVLPANITATGSATSATNIAAVMSGAPLKFASDYTIKYVNGSWEIYPNTNAPIPTRAINAAFVTATAAAQVGFSTTLAAGTYYYKIWTRDLTNRLSASSSEVSCTIDGTTTLPELVINAEGAPNTVRIVRGTATGTYTQYAQVPVSVAVQYLYDQGSHIAGVAWQAWAGSPAIPASTGSQTRNGWYYPETGQSEFRASSIPTDGAWVQGDKCWNTNPGAGGPLGWKCTASGSPGTWESMVAVPIVAKTATYTVTVSDQVLLGNATSGNIVFNLPAAANCAGQWFVAKKTDSSANTVTVDPNSSETIDGATTKVLSTQYASVMFISDGTAWWTI